MKADKYNISFNSDFVSCKINNFCSGCKIVKEKGNSCSLPVEEYREAVPLSGTLVPKSASMHRHQDDFGTAIDRFIDQWILYSIQNRRWKN